MIDIYTEVIDHILEGIHDLIDTGLKEEPHKFIYLHNVCNTICLMRGENKFYTINNIDDDLFMCVFKEVVNYVIN